MPLKKTLAPALLWKRIAAFIVDLIILDLAVIAPFRKIILKLLPGDLKTIQGYLLQSQKTANLIITLSIIIGILVIFYFAVLEYKLGQSTGKIIFKLYVVSDAERLGFWQCVFRSIFLIPVFPFILFWAIDPVYMFFSEKNQRLLERWSSTRTVEEI